MSKTNGRVLFIGHLWPEPASSAAGYRTLSLLRAFNSYPHQKSWHIHFASAAEKTEFCADLDTLNINTHAIKLNDSSFDSLVSSIQPDIVIYDRFITEEQFASRVVQQCPEAMNILDTQDLHFLRRARQQALHAGRQNNMPSEHKTGSEPALDTALTPGLQTLDLQTMDLQTLDLQTDDAIREIAAILRCDLSLIISTYEMDLLQQQFKLDSNLIHYCPFMLAMDHHLNLPGFYQREHFVMIGNFLHPPNWDAVLWCYQSIWPQIRKQLPQAELHIYGAYPSEKVWQLHQPEKGFLVKGRAENALQSLQHYRVNLAPLRYGAGIKGKIADGFMTRTPCVTTQIGAEGMAGHLPWGGLIANDEQSLARQAIKLYQNQAVWHECSEQAEQIIRKQFDEKYHARLLLEKIIKIKEQLTTHRKNNFLGKILRHQLYRSSYFMSKWIEEKNKPC